MKIMKLLTFVFSLGAVIFLVKCSDLPRTTQLPFYKESLHFKVFCTNQDKEVANKILQESEQFFDKLSQDFNHQYSTKIIYKIYPDIILFHRAMNSPEAPDWFVSVAKDHTIYTVSPLNSGSSHSYHSVIKGNRVGIAELFIYDKYENNESIPRWLHQGTALFKSNYFTKKVFDKLAQNVDALPTLTQLESIQKIGDDEAFDKMNGFIVSYSLAAFINEKWGWYAILQLLDDYSAFEKILNISKDEFHNQWILFLKEQTQNKLI